MGTVRSQIEHLVKEHSQPWEHRCKQFTCETGRSRPWVHPSLTLFKGWQPHRKHLYLEIAAFGVLGEPWFSERGKWFLLCYQVGTATLLGRSKASCCCLSLHLPIEFTDVLAAVQQIFGWSQTKLVPESWIINIKIFTIWEHIVEPLFFLC